MEHGPSRTSILPLLILSMLPNASLMQKRPSSHETNATKSLSWTTIPHLLDLISCQGCSVHQSLQFPNHIQKNCTLSMTIAQDCTLSIPGSRKRMLPYV